MNLGIIPYLDELSLEKKREIVAKIIDLTIENNLSRSQLVEICIEVVNQIDNSYIFNKNKLN